MDEKTEALSADGAAEESGGYSPGDWAEGAGKKRLKLQAKDDRISALPDSLIQHIISFLPSTKQAIQTGILSKRWRNQWSRVPVLIFAPAGKYDKNFSQFIDRTLTMHDCSKLKKFQIKYDDHPYHDPQLTSKIRFATRKNVEELILHLCPVHDCREDIYKLPEFLVSNDSLVKLELLKCCFYKPNWPNLKELKLEYSSSENKVKALQHIISGCPLLESLELTKVYYPDNDVIASKSLKRLIFVDAETDEDSHCFEISCPSLRGIIDNDISFVSRFFNLAESND